MTIMMTSLAFRAALRWPVFGDHTAPFPFFLRLILPCGCILWCRRRGQVRCGQRQQRLFLVLKHPPFVCTYLRRNCLRSTEAVTSIVIPRGSTSRLAPRSRRVLGHMGRASGAGKGEQRSTQVPRICLFPASCPSDRPLARMLWNCFSLRMRGRR